MRRKYLVISIVIAFVCCFLFVISRGKNTIDVKQILTRDLRGRTVYINVFCEDASEKGSLGALWRSFIDDGIREILIAKGVLASFDETNCEFLIDCGYKNGLCFPYLGRHFDVHTVGFQSVRLKILDTKTRNVVGELQAKRSRFNRPSKDFINEIITNGIPYLNSPSQK
jgi:hypothetical protein